MAVRSLHSMVSTAVLSHVHGSSPMLNAAFLSGFVRSRGIHSRVAQTAQTVHPRAADGAFAAMTVAASSAFAGVWYWTNDTHKSSVLMGGEDPAMKTEGYLRREQAAAEVKRARASYNEAVVVEEDDDDDAAMRAKIEDWIKKYRRRYKDEEEKARRYRIFKASAWSVDVNNAEAAKSGSNAKFGLTQFADWNSQEIRSRCCSEIS